jgi:hypothetical protein
MTWVETRALFGWHSRLQVRFGLERLGKVGGDPDRPEGVAADFRRDAGRLGAARFGHNSMGVCADVVDRGDIAVGNVLSIASIAGPAPKDEN